MARVGSIGGGALFAAAFAAALAVGCGSKVSLEDGKAKVAELAAMGVPEREMSDINMYLFQMATAKKTGNSGQFKLYQDSLTRALGDFESKMDAILETAGPLMDSLMRASDEKIAGLKGLHLEAARKSRAPVDSLMKIESQKLYAKGRAQDFALYVDTLVIQQRLADSLRGQFVGIWVMEREPADSRFKMVERTEIHMRPDGSLYIMEGKKGQIDQDAREDWLFESRGTWDVMGDVAYHYLTREKRVRQIFEGIDPQTGARRKQSQPPYDSTLAKGTKDRYVAWDELNKDYKRFPIKK